MRRDGQEHKESTAREFSPIVRGFFFMSANKEDEKKCARQSGLSGTEITSKLDELLDNK